MERIILVQHCQSHHHVNREARLWPDRRNGLTDLGRKQAVAIGQRLRRDLDGRNSRLFSSDMRRASETAEIIADCLERTPTLVPALREFNGTLAVERTGLGPERNPPDQPWSLFDWQPFPGAETWRQFQARVSEWVDELSGQPDEALPIIVGHGGSINCVVVWWLRLELDAMCERNPFTPGAASISVLEKNSFGSPKIERLGDRGHLYEEGLALRSDLAGETNT